MKIEKTKIPEKLMPIIEMTPAVLKVGKVEEVKLSQCTPEEQWKLLLKGAEIGAHLAGWGLGLISIGDGQENKTLGPYKALPLAHRGMELIKELRNLSDEYHSKAPPAWPEEDLQALNQILEKLERSFGALLESEKTMMGLGWKLDKKTEGMKRIAKHEGEDLFGAAVWGVYQAIYVKKGGKGPGPTPEVVQGVAEALSANYPASQLGTGTRDPIYRAIYMREYRKS